MSRAEEIAKRCAADICNLALAKSPSTHILAALHEYGQAVRARDAEICGKVKRLDAIYVKAKRTYAIGCDDCAAEISKEPLS